MQDWVTAMGKGKSDFSRCSGVVLFPSDSRKARNAGRSEMGTTCISLVSLVLTLLRCESSILSATRVGIGSFCPILTTTFSIALLGPKFFGGPMDIGQSIFTFTGRANQWASSR